MRRLMFMFAAMAGWLLLLIACSKKQDDEPETTTSDQARFVVPSNFPKPVYNFENNTLTQAGFDLGHKLFYEDGLSVDKSTNCGTCHQQFAAFANLDHSVSHGVNNCFGTRNAPPLYNLAWQQDMMWDGGVHNIEVSPLNALTNSCEMGNTLDNIVKTLQQSPVYPEMFKKAFGTTEINSQRLLKALTQFIGTMVSANSKYDKYTRNEQGGTFTADELAGYKLFQQNCAVCHKEPLFTDNSFRSNGLDLVSKDKGRDSITQTASDFGKFRVPSLRNVELSRPYMHDGRFYTLEAVLQHYASGVQHAANLDPELRKNGRLGIALNTTEQAQIITFLKTLTDNDFTHDKKFAEL